MERLSTAAIADAGLTDWRKLDQSIKARFRIPDFVTGAHFISAVAAAAEIANHHPELRLTYGVVEVELRTHAAGYVVTALDVDLARTISAIAAAHTLVADPAGIAQILLALDTADEDVIGPFWSVLLTGSAGNKVGDAVTDPTGRVPTVWFQSADSGEEPRQRWHMDLWLAPEVADERIAAAVAVGGRIVNAAEAPAYTVLADQDGNRVCVCTSRGRD